MTVLPTWIERTPYPAYVPPKNVEELADSINSTDPGGSDDLVWSVIDLLEGVIGHTPECHPPPVNHPLYLPYVAVAIVDFTAVSVEEDDAALLMVGDANSVRGEVALTHYFASHAIDAGLRTYCNKDACKQRGSLWPVVCYYRSSSRTLLLYTSLLLKLNRLFRSCTLKTPKGRGQQGRLQDEQEEKTTMDAKDFINKIKQAMKR